MCMCALTIYQKRRIFHGSRHVVHLNAKLLVGPICCCSGGSPVHRATAWKYAGMERLTYNNHTDIQARGFVMFGSGMCTRTMLAHVPYVYTYYTYIQTYLCTGDPWW